MSSHYHEILLLRLERITSTASMFITICNPPDTIATLRINLFQCRWVEFNLAERIPSYGNRPTRHRTRRIDSGSMFWRSAAAAVLVRSFTTLLVECALQDLSCFVGVLRRMKAPRIFQSPNVPSLSRPIALSGKPSSLRFPSPIRMFLSLSARA